MFKNMKKDHFAEKASTYDSGNDRTQNVDNIANLIKEKIELNNSMHLMDFGSGTGLLLERIAPFIQKITAVDVSPSMNDQLRRKNLPCELELKELDLTTEKLDQSFDGIISSMTMHHIKNAKAMFQTFHSLLNENGFIAIADLDSEDGSFHTKDTGVHHFGFDREAFMKLAESTGFKNIRTLTVGEIEKSHGTYSVFLLIGKKNI